MDEESTSEKEYVPYVPLPGEQPSEYRKKLYELTRKLKKKSAEADAFIADVQNKSDRNLAKRNGILRKTAQIEDMRRATVMQNTELKEKFVIEVDEAIELKAQNRAERLYHKEQINLMVPKWLKTLDEISRVAKAKGHNDKLKWRHFVLDVMKTCIDEASEDPLGVETRLHLIFISRRLNIYNANEVIRKLEDLKDEYFRVNEIGRASCRERV